MTTQFLFDLESTGLLRRGSTIHCIVMRDMNSVDEPIVFDYKPERAVIQGVKQLEQADALIGHNIINYDIPLIKEQHEDFDPQGELIDTLVLSRLYYPNIIERDYEIRPHGMPKNTTDRKPGTGGFTQGIAIQQQRVRDKGAELKRSKALRPTTDMGMYDIYK